MLKNVENEEKKSKTTSSETRNKQDVKKQNKQKHSTKHTTWKKLRWWGRGFIIHLTSERRDTW